MNEQDFRTRLDAELSSVAWTAENRRQVRNATQKGGIMMKKKLIVAAVLAAVVLMGTVTAYAAGLIFTPQADAGLAADRILEERYGITQEMLAYFHRQTALQPDGTAIVSYKGNWELEYVLGEYTVTVNGGKAEAAWSHDGEDTSGGFDAPAWGREQLADILFIQRENRKEPGKNINLHIYEKAMEIAQAHGAGKQPAAPHASVTEEQFEQEQSGLKKLSKLSEEELVSLAREAAQAAYGLSEEQMGMLLHNPDLSLYYYSDGGELCYEASLYLVQRSASAPDAVPEYTEGDGAYIVILNTDSGAIESVSYETDLAGNG